MISKSYRFRWYWLGIRTLSSTYWIHTHSYWILYINCPIHCPVIHRHAPFEEDEIFEVISEDVCEVHKPKLYRMHKSPWFQSSDHLSLIVFWDKKTEPTHSLIRTKENSGFNKTCAQATDSSATFTCTKYNAQWRWSVLQNTLSSTSI